MDAETKTERLYVLGSGAEELARLDAQAASIERPTRHLLQSAGLTTGMRVPDLGTGLGHVARLAGEIVGPTGSVVGIDRSADVLAAARERTAQAGMTQVALVEGNAIEWRRASSISVAGRIVPST